MKNGKLKKRALIFLSIFIFGWLAIVLANYFNYRSKIPSEYGESYWTGEWESDDYFMISGRIVADLPENITPNQEFEFNATIYYDLWSLYKTGETHEIIMVGVFSNKMTEGDNSENPTETEYTVKFNIKNPTSESYISEQQISYSGNCDKDFTKVSGYYATVNPSDNGAFYIDK
ncbi:hypothetical protein K6119_09930 [Paracrocinitomix mangrovi]|uniref:hypothetical protein n=1 Tax=Paracrocinitomix mangrovi TaxID=2862509 RepID=UPI001C8ECB71|nr:hypothetical protein [Paracrocinitomix mangrovi]UKN03809.1 hypothetical protein K6119_09930 [Paracrocinitomix mangrovi]